MAPSTFSAFFPDGKTKPNGSKGSRSVVVGLWHSGECWMFDFHDMPDIDHASI
jgi:hypothetical protein